MRNPVLLSAMALGASILTFPIVASAELPKSVKTTMPDVDTVGKGRLNYLIWDVYDAELFAPQGHWAPGKPLALKLSYLMDLKGADIASRSVEEMRKIGFNDELMLATWHDQMRKIFPNVGSGDALIGVYAPDGETQFYHNNTLIGTVKDPEFGKYFFGIWLDEKSSEPGLRKQLLGLR